MVINHTKSYLNYQPLQKSTPVKFTKKLITLAYIKIFDIMRKKAKVDKDHKNIQI